MTDLEKQSSDTLNLSVGDLVVVTIHTHKQETGIVSHITKANSIFIRTETRRLRVVAQDIRKCIQIKTKASKTTLSSKEIQYYINQRTESNGLNYHGIGRNYESGSDGFPIDFRQAMSWYKSGHKLENIHCIANLARISSDYYHNYDEAEKYWNIGIDLGFGHCAFAANVMFRTVRNGKDKELYYIDKYVKLTNGTGGLLSFAVCQLTMDVPDYSEAYKYLIKALELNNNSIGVQQFLAFTVYRGLGCPKDEKKAFEMHAKLAKDKNSECSMLWMAVYKARNDNNYNNIHPLREQIYNSFINVVENGDSHGLYYGNWIKINQYHALQKKNIFSCCLIIALKIFGILQCVINIKDVRSCVENIVDLHKNKNKVVDPWMKSWIWFFSERYRIINTVSGLQNGLIHIITELELSLFVQ